MDKTQGNCQHHIFVEHASQVPPYLVLYNDEDSYYFQTFHSRAAIDAFIARLQEAADACWPTAAP